jgi:hypothetical protein
VAAARVSEATQHSDCRGFSSAIRSKKTKNRSSLDLKGKILHRMNVPITLAQMIEHDNWFIHGETLLRR